MTCFLCGDCCAVDRCDDCGKRICERHTHKRRDGNMLYCDRCVPYLDAVMRRYQAGQLARRITPRFARYAAQDEVTRLEAAGWTKADFTHALTELLEAR